MNTGFRGGDRTGALGRSALVSFVLMSAPHTPSNESDHVIPNGLIYRAVVFFVASPWPACSVIFRSGRRQPGKFLRRSVFLCVTPIFILSPSFGYRKRIVKIQKRL